MFSSANIYCEVLPKSVSCFTWLIFQVCLFGWSLFAFSFNLCLQGVDWKQGWMWQWLRTLRHHCAPCSHSPVSSGNLHYWSVHLLLLPHDEKLRTQQGKCYFFYFHILHKSFKEMWCAYYFLKYYGMATHADSAFFLLLSYFARKKCFIKNIFFVMSQPADGFFVGLISFVLWEIQWHFLFSIHNHFIYYHYWGVCRSLSKRYFCLNSSVVPRAPVW